MEIKYILRFYGSCGHIENTEISLEEFERWSAERLSKTIFGDHLVKAEVTVEENNKIVHIYPERYCCCCGIVLKEQITKWNINFEDDLHELPQNNL